MENPIIYITNFCLGAILGNTYIQNTWISKLIDSIDDPDQPLHYGGTKYDFNDLETGRIRIKR